MSIDTRRNSRRPEVSEVRHADLSVEVRPLIANVHAQIHDVLARYGVGSIAELQVKLNLAGQAARRDARSDVSRLIQLTERLHMLWDEHAQIAAAYADRADATELAGRAMHDIAVYTITILDYAYDGAPYDLPMLTSLLELALFRGQEYVATHLLDQIKMSVEKTVKNNPADLNNELQLAPKVFRLLGQFAQEGEMHLLLTTFEEESQPYMLAAYAAGLAGAGDAAGAAEYMREADARIDDAWDHAANACAHVGFSAAQVGIILPETAGLVRAERIADVRKRLNMTAVVLLYGILGDEESVRRLGEKWPKAEVAGGWDKLAVYYAEHGDLAAAERCIKKSPRYSDVGRRALQHAIINTRDATRLADVLAGEYDLVIDDEALDADALAWLCTNTAEFSFSESFRAAYSEALYREGRYDELCKEGERDPDTAYYASALYRIGKKRSGIWRVCIDYSAGRALGVCCGCS